MSEMVLTAADPMATRPRLTGPRLTGPKLSRAVAWLLLWVCCAGLAGAIQLEAPPESSLLPESSSTTEPTDPAYIGRVIHVRIESVLDAGVQGLVSRALRETRPGDTFVIELDTPGGPADLMWQIAQSIDAANKRGVQTVAWVNRTAASAGAFIAMSCDFLFLVRHGTLGSSTPVMSTPGGIVEMPEEIREKQYSLFRSEFRGWAEAHGYPPALAEAMVDREVEVEKVYVEGEGPRYVTQADFEQLRSNSDREVTRLATVVQAGELLNMTGSEAVELQFADGVRDSLDEVLSKLGLAKAELLRFEPTRSEEFASLLASVKWILFAAGLFLAYLELKIPGFGIPGALSIACFATFLLGQYLVGLADVVHFVAVGAGLVLIAVELFLMPGAIWPAAAGAVLLLGGLLMALVGSTDGLRYDLGRSILVDGSFRLMVGCFSALLLGAIASRFLPKTALGKHLVLQPAGDAFGAALPPVASSSPGSAHSSVPGPASSARVGVGALGFAQTPLRPVGKVALAHAPLSSYEARAAGDALEAGTRVRVVEVQGSRLVVESAESEATPTGESA